MKIHVLCTRPGRGRSTVGPGRCREFLTEKVKGEEPSCGSKMAPVREP